MRHRRAGDAVSLEPWGTGAVAAGPAPAASGSEVDALTSLVLELRGAIGALTRLGPRMRGPMGARVEAAAAELAAVMVRRFPDG